MFVFIYELVLASINLEQRFLLCLSTLEEHGSVSL